MARVAIVAISAVFAISMLLLAMVGCGGGDDRGFQGIDGDEPEGREVRGFVLGAVGRNLAEIESFSVRDELGRVWDFTTEGLVGSTASHLRQHQITGELVRVVYFERDGLLIATLVEDGATEHGPVGGGGI